MLYDYAQLGSPELCRVNWQVEHPGELKAGRLETQEEPVSVQVWKQDRLMFQLEDSQERRILLYLGEGQPFVFFRPSADWVRPTHIRESNLPYSIKLNVNLSQNLNS